VILRGLRRALPIALLLSAAAGIAVAFASGEGLRADALGRVSAGMLALAVMLGFVPWAMDTLRLHLWAGVVEAPIPLRSALRVVVGAELGSAATPTAVGGLPVKLALLKDEGVPAATGVTLCAVKGFEDALFFLVAIPLAVFLTAGSTLPAMRSLVSALPVQGVAAMGAGAVVLVALAGWLARRSRFPFLSRVRASARLAWRAGVPRFTLSLSCTSLQWIARYSAITALAAGLGAPVDPVRFWLLQWVVFTAMTLVPTPGGSGGAEAAFALAYGGILPAELMTWLVLGWRSVTFYVLVGAGALLFALLETRRHRAGVPFVSPSGGRPEPAATCTLDSTPTTPP
jgi:glycosyltransferase 2 family protein